MNGNFAPEYADVRERLTAAHRWEMPDRPPLQLVCSGQGGLDMPSFTESLANPQILLEHQVAQAHAIRAIESDAIPTIVPVPNSAVLVPSMYGCEIEELESVWARPVKKTLIDIVDGLAPPSLDAGLMPAYARNTQYFVDHAPKWAHVCSPIPHEALESAVYLLGQDLFVAMHDHPDEVHALFRALTQTHVATILRLKEILGEPRDRMVSHKGTYLPATRLACDSVVNLSPVMLANFFIPHIRHLARTIGTRIHLHWCSIAANPARHVPGTLARAPDVFTGIATHYHCFGESDDPVVLQESLGGRFALTLDLQARQSISAFRYWAEDLEGRWEQPTGVILRMIVKSVDDGRERMDIWREVWNRRVA